MIFLATWTFFIATIFLPPRSMQPAALCVGAAVGGFGAVCAWLSD